MQITSSSTLLKEYIELDRIYNLFVGLNFEFDQVRVQILGKVPKTNEVGFGGRGGENFFLRSLPLLACLLFFQFYLLVRLDNLRILFIALVANDIFLTQHPNVFFGERID
jgi:hypothetical protein